MLSTAGDVSQTPPRTARSPTPRLPPSLRPAAAPQPPGEGGKPLLGAGFVLHVALQPLRCGGVTRPAGPPAPPRTSLPSPATPRRPPGQVCARKPVRVEPGPAEVSSLTFRTWPPWTPTTGWRLRCPRRECGLRTCPGDSGIRLDQETAERASLTSSGRGAGDGRSAQPLASPVPPRRRPPPLSAFSSRPCLQICGPPIAQALSLGQTQALVQGGQRCPVTGRNAVALACSPTSRHARPIRSHHGPCPQHRQRPRDPGREALEQNQDQQARRGRSGAFSSGPSSAGRGPRVDTGPCGATRLCETGPKAADMREGRSVNSDIGRNCPNEAKRETSQGANYRQESARRGTASSLPAHG